MNGIARMGCRAVMVAILAALVASPALALDNPWITTLTSTQGSYTDNLTATVTWEGDHFHYLYELDFQHTYVRPADHYSYPLTVLTVGNVPNYAFAGAGNDAGWNNPVHDPNNGGANSVLWDNTDPPRVPKPGVPVGRVVKFWYDSTYGPKVVTVSMTAGRAGGGQTLGMSPEPGVLVSLGAGIAALGGMILRRRIVK